jgi:hypothetical protein
MDIERREMNQLIELLQEGGVGYVPKRKLNGWVSCLRIGIVWGCSHTVGKWNG